MLEVLVGILLLGIAEPPVRTVVIENGRQLVAHVMKIEETPAYEVFISWKAPAGASGGITTSILACDPVSHLCKLPIFQRFPEQGVGWIEFRVCIYDPVTRTSTCSPWVREVELWCDPSITTDHGAVGCPCDAFVRTRGTTCVYP